MCVCVGSYLKKMRGTGMQQPILCSSRNKKTLVTFLLQWIKLTHTESSHSQLQINLQTLYKQACCFSTNALKVTGHLSLVVPLWVLQDENPGVSWAFLSCHVRVDGGQDASVTGNGENHFTIQQPHHHGPLGVGGGTGIPCLVSSQNSQSLRWQHQLSSSL